MSLLLLFRPFQIVDGVRQLHIKGVSTWTTDVVSYIKYNGAWVIPEGAYVKVDGVWQKVWGGTGGGVDPNTYLVTLDGNTVVTLAGEEFIVT
ncbi:hypothetical protein [Microcystis sp. M061S2]|uniref:hypothetical protein n=1 Tax=Microcystis sp. M061S2 TaxID=2771171 RepID=UPI00258EFCC9|nr:hypothetical protein [Microcystis sp. M061S2]MCA2653769.1 hypothetical protein [Microcystis sp. M061S2]